MIKRNSRLVNQKFTEFFVASILMAASISLSIMIDSIIVGNVLGEKQLAAVNLVMPLSLCFTAVCAIFGIGSSTLISVLKGKMEQEKANQVFSLAGIAWAFMSIIGIILGLFLCHPIASFLSGASGLKDYVLQYLRVYLIGAPFTFAMLILPYILKSDGRTKLASVTLVTANVVNLILDVVFMKYCGMGLAGGALATISGYIVGTAMGITYFKSPERSIHFAKIKWVDLKMYRDMFEYSISSCLGQGLMFLKVWIFNMLAASLEGQNGIVAFSVCMSCLSLVSMFISGGAQTMIPMVGSFRGAKDQTAVHLTMKTTLRLVLVSCLVVTIFLELFPRQVLGVYGVVETEAVLLGMEALRLFALSFIGVGFTFIMMYYFQAIAMPAFSMQICALDGLLVVVPIGFALSRIMGLNGIWLAFPLTGICMFLFITIKSRYLAKKSGGRLYSVFLFEQTSQTEKKLEVTVDVMSAEKREEAAVQLTDFVMDQSAQFAAKQSEIIVAGTELGIDVQKIKSVIEDVLYLSTLDYEATTEHKSGFGMVDIILTMSDRIELSVEDVGRARQAIKDNQAVVIQELSEGLESRVKKYDWTLMIGMNQTRVVM